MRPGTVSLLSLCLFASSLYGMEDSPGDNIPSIELKPYPGAKGTDWRQGTLSVWENREAKKGRKISLHIVVLPAKSKNPKPDPVFFLHGGPGAAATTMASAFSRSWMRQDRDIVLVDQRGTGKSNPLHVPVPGGPENLQGYLDPLFQVEPFRKALPLLQKRADLRLYTTPIAMDDLDEVRAALGYDRINLIGGSYGTRAALVYMRRHEKHVRTATLMGVAPPSFRNPLYHAKAAQQGLEKIFQEVAKDPKAAKAFPRLPQTFQKVLKQLDQKPVTLTLTDQRGKMHRVSMDRDAFSSALHAMMYTEKTNRRIPLLISQCANGNWRPFVIQAILTNRGLRGIVALGMTISVVGSEDIPRITEADLRQETKGTFRDDGRARQQIAVSKIWPTGKVPKNYGDPVQAKVPALLISGTHDPITPPKWGAKAAKHLPNSLHIIVPATHGSFGPEVEAIKKQFLNQGTVKGLDLSPIQKRKLAPFVLPKKETSR